MNKIHKIVKGLILIAQKHSYSPFTNKFCFLTTELSPFISGLDGFMVSFNKFTTVETKERKDK